MSPSEEDLRALASLPTYGPPEEVVARVVRRARARAGESPAGRLARRATEIALPIGLLGIVAVYLSWAVELVNRLHR